VHGWIEPFFERAQPAIEAGHVWSAQPIELAPTHGLKIGRVDPKDDAKLDFKVVARGDAQFGHAPIHSLGLRSDEAIVLARAARSRAVVVIGATAGAAHLRGGSVGDGEGGHGDDEAALAAIVVPLYAADAYDADTRRRVARYDFADAFYLPASERPRSPESIARLDHAQPLRRADLLEHRGYKLAADALDALVEWFVAFTTNRLLDDSLILEYRRQLLDSSE
jgi:hypothetical protein